MDRLAVLLQHYTLSADVFHTGEFCGEKAYDGAHGYLHLLRSGDVAVTSSLHSPLYLNEPCLLLYPRPARHVFITANGGTADLICAQVDLGSVSGSPIAYALPDMLRIPLGSMPGMAATLDLLVDESYGELCGRQAAMNRLCELLLIHLFRYLMNSESAPTGLLAGLADKRLAKAITAIHEQPAEAWTLDRMADAAGMSRARFAAAFRGTVGCTPGAYLSVWRINLACKYLRQGKPVAWTADAVGYGSATALARAFRANTGQSPAERSKTGN